MEHIIEDLQILYEDIAESDIDRLDIPKILKFDLINLMNQQNNQFDNYIFADYNTIDQDQEDS